MDPVFSICMPTYNRADLLDFTLGRLQEIEKHGKQFEIVLSDNHSTDRTPAVIEARQKTMPYLRNCRQARTVGPLDNWLNAMRNARADIVVYIADDDSIIAENLIKHVERLERERDLVGIFTDWIAYDDAEEKELHRYFQFKEPVSFGRDNPLGLINFIFQNLVYPEIGIYRRDPFLQAAHFVKRGVWLHLWAYRLSRFGRIAFDLLPFYREHRVLKKQFQRDHWANMDTQMFYIGDELRNVLESMLLLALQDSGVPKVPDDQVLRVKQMIESFLHGRTWLQIQRAAGAKNWILAVELRRRLTLWYGPGSAEEQQRDVLQLSFPAALQAVHDTYRSLSGASGVDFRGFRTRQVHDFFRTHYPDVPLVEAGQPAAAADGKQPLIVYKQAADQPKQLEPGMLPGYVLTLAGLVEAYRLVPNPVDWSPL